MRMVSVIEKLNSLRKSETNTLDFKLKNFKQIEKLRTERGLWVFEDKDKNDNNGGGEYQGLKSEIKEGMDKRGIVVLQRKKKRVGVVVGIVIL